MSYIGVDMGTSGCKAAVMDREGRVMASAHRDYPFVIPQPGWAELDPGVIWRAVVEVLRELAPLAGYAEALAVSTIGESMVMTDADDKVLHNAIVYVDSRCENTLPLIEAVMSARDIHDHTGMTLNQMYSLNKLLWFREHRPEILDRTQKIFLMIDYIGYMLAGERLVDPSTASRSMLLEARTLSWSEELMRKFALDPGLFSPIGEPGTRLGTLRSAVAAETGLPSDLVVLLGSHDQACANLGSGIYEAGDILVAQGSSESLNMVIELENIGDALIDNGVGFEPYFAGKYFVTAAQLTHGTSIRWFVDMFRKEMEAERVDAGESLYAFADRMCAADAASLFFLPYMSGVDPNDADNDARGCFIGLDVTVDIWRMYRAVLEGLCFETRMRLERLMRCGVPPRMMVASGGAAKSNLLMQMKTDVMGRSLRVLDSEEAGIKGLGMICAVARGEFASYSDAAAVYVKATKEFAPQKKYDRQFAVYKTMANHIRTLYRELR